LAQQDDQDRTQTHTILTKGTMVGHYRKVALKFLPPHLCQDEDCRARFKREAQAAAKLSHPNIIHVYEVSEHQGRPFFAMEHVEGRSLRDVDVGELSGDRIVGIAIQLCDGLQSAHTSGVTHRDIKPSNIVVDVSGRPKLLDFGLATVAGGEHITKTGSTLGTVGYMSPEQIEGKPTDARSDLFSLGVVLYELIAGRAPFRRDDEAATLRAVLTDTPEPLARFKIDVPADLQVIVSKLLEKDPGLRYQHADGVISDLKRLSRDTQTGARRRPAASSRKRASQVVVPSLILIIAVLVLVFRPWRLEVRSTDEVMAAQNSLAIMYFDNLTDPDDTQMLGEIAANLLITDLTESVYLNVVSSQHLYDILKLLDRGSQANIDREVATEVAKRAGSKWMLLGSILQVEPQLVITSQLVEVSSGRVVSTQRVSGEPGESAFAVIDRLSAEIKKDMSLPQQALDETDRAVADVTTHSPEAYRYYIEGLMDQYEYMLEEAEDSYQKALGLDSTFAMAYFRLATMYFLPFGMLHQDYMASAVKYSANLPRKEQLYIESFQNVAARDYSAAVAQLEKTAGLFPQEKEACLLEGGVHLCFRNAPVEAIAAFTAAIRIDSLNKVAYNYLAYAYDQIGDTERSDWAIETYLTLAPDETNPYDTRADLYAGRGETDSAIEYYLKALDTKRTAYITLRKLGRLYARNGDYEQAEACFRRALSDSRLWFRQSARADLAYVPTYRGQFERALGILDQGIAADQTENGADFSSDKHTLKADLLHMMSEVGPAMREINKAMVIARSRNSVTYSRHDYVKFLAESDSIAKAEELIGQLKEDIEQNDPTLLYLYWYAKGCIEFARGNAREAVVWLEKATDDVYYRWSRTYGLRHFMLGRAYLEAGQFRQAATQFEKLLSRNFNLEPAFLPVLARYYMGQAFEQSGQIDKAVGQYEIFLDIWKDADDEIHEIEDARACLARIKAE